MNERTLFIRETAARLLAEGRTDRVVGYAPGTTALRSAPLVARTPEEARTLAWNSFCLGNPAKTALGLATQNPDLRLTVVAQGCASRSLAVLLAENRLARNRLTVIGVPCLGMADPAKILAECQGREPRSMDEDPETLTARGRNWEKPLKRQFMLRDNCHTCLHRNPVLNDFPAARPVEETGGGDIERTSGPWEILAPAERFAKLQDTYQDCIRCYACRDACPLCSCPTCFVDQSDPQWVGKTQDFSDLATYHLLRAFHCAGRCTDCGACESACPQGLKVRRLTSKLERDARSLFGCQPGMSPDTPPPLAAWKTDDPQEFII